ncbi:MAG: hypothetical protein J1E62_00280 [Lachnospiraceae bacterium]|nr:hypothetical protein [Lachnospiraceae bacterium]
MTHLLILREYIHKLYQRYTFLFHFSFRFLIGFIVFFAINRVLGYQPVLNHMYVNVIMGLISMIFPLEALLFLASGFVVLHIVYVSNILAFSVAVIFLILYLLYIQFFPKYGYVVLAVPLAYSMGLSGGVPVLLGLIAEPIILVPGLIGVGLYYLLHTLTSVVASATDDTINLFQVLINQFVSDKEMLASFVIFFAVTLIVYVLRNLKIKYSFEIAVFFGIISNLILFLIAGYMQLVRIQMLQFFLGSTASFFLVLLIQFFRLSLNYADVENLQFEDEEYYYYVRAVPKNNIAPKNKRIKRFNAHLFSQRVTYLEKEELQRVQDAITGEKEEKEDS